MSIHPVVVETLLAELAQDEPALTKEMRKRLKLRTPAQKRIMRWRRQQQPQRYEDGDDA